MDEMENQELRQETEYQEETTAEEVTAATEEASVEEAPVRTEEAVEEAPVIPPVIPPQPRRRSPYENSPYVMHHQQTQQVPPVQTPPPAQPPVQPEESEKSGKERKRHPVLAVVLMLLAIVMTIFASVRMTLTFCENYENARINLLQEQMADLQEQLREQQNTGNSVSGTPNAGIGDGMTPGQVFARNEKSVVLIETDVSSGSGFILTTDGYVVTNYHVVEDGSQIQVVLSDRTYHDASLVGYEASNDVALLKIQGTDFPAVTLGSSDDLIVGDQVVAIGNPLGELTSTLTVGFVSATGRNVSTDSSVINMIQTDCAINSGNSGGPLFNMKGEVVGITTAKYSGMTTSGASIEGIGFAIPMDDVVGILDDLMEFGYVKSAYLGVSVYTLEPSPEYPLGCLVDSVVPDGCADKAGVLPGDIIIELAGCDIDGYSDLGRVLREFDGGETVTIVVWRENVGNVSLEITLDAKPREGIPETEEKPMPEDGSYEEWYEYFFGE